jgi:energy-coupling factor transporter ATP-binding protein EcfA2
MALIAIEGLSFRFQGSSHDALRDVSLSISPGEFVVVAGPSGCGKSTLALAVGGYLFHQYDGETNGSVTVAGMDVGQYPIYDVAEVVGLVQQNPEAQFCTLTVQDEIAFGLENRRVPPHDIRERIDWVLSIVGATHLADRPLANLSGGEKQKVAIAAMMASKPQVLIFDEPTSNLDPTATAEIFGVISHIRAKAGITVIVVEHKVDYLLPFEPRLVVMEEGSIAYDGPFDRSQLAQIPANEHSHHVPSGKESIVAQGRSMTLHMEDVEVGHNGQPVLQDVSLRIGPGEFIAVMGDNGSGKTTLLQTMMGLLKPQRGWVEVLGHDMGEKAVSSLAREVGFVFQNPDHQLFAESVWQEAIFAPSNFGVLDNETCARVRDLLATCGLEGRLDEHPYRLSYGEKRRLNLISVLAYSPRLILLDEVLIGQDPRNAAFLLDLLQERVLRGDTVVMVNHAPEITARYATRLLFFNSGQIRVDAPPQEAFRQMAAQDRRLYLPGRTFVGDQHPAGSQA